MKEYQVTLTSTCGYRPVSCIITADETRLALIGKSAFIKELQKKGIQKIAAKRLWGSRELKEYGYTKAKIREYDKERIERENAERYEKIKEERGWK